MRDSFASFVVLGLSTAFLLAMAAFGPASAGEILMTEPINEIGFDQNLGTRLPLDARFLDHEGREVRLGDYFDGERPVLIALVYFECPMLCNMVLNGVVTSLRPLIFEPGEEFEFVVVSFDPGEGPELSAAKRTNYLEDYDRPHTEPGWHFLTGEASSIAALTDSVGFRYVYDEETDQYAHASGIVLATPDGVVSRYLFGIDYAPKDLRLGLVEASEGKIGGAVEQLLLLCFQYDPTTGRYGAAVMFFMRLGGVLTVLALLAFILLHRLRERKSRAAAVEEQLGGMV